MKQITMKFTATELNHLYVLLLKNEDDGYYNGPKTQYWNRHERIKTKLEEAD